MDWGKATFSLQQVSRVSSLFFQNNPLIARNFGFTMMEILLISYTVGIPLSSLIISKKGLIDFTFSNSFWMIDSTA